MTTQKYVHANVTLEKVDDDTGHNSLYVPRFLYKELPVAYNLIGMTLNIILMTYFVKSKKHRVPTFTLLTSLSVTDMLCCLAAIGYGGLLYPHLIFPDAGFLCPLSTFLSCFSLLSSGYHLVFFAALRFYQLVFPLAARARVTCSFVLKGCLTFQFMIVIFAATFAAYHPPTRMLLDDEMFTFCVWKGVLRARDIAWSVTSTLLPCVAILVLHLAKYIGVAITSKSSLDVDHDRTRNADARAVAIVIILFYIAWFVPNSYLIITSQTTENYDHTTDLLWLVFVQISFSNSTLNPLVYCFAAKSVRDDLLNMLCSKREKLAHHKQRI